MCLQAQHSVGMQGSIRRHGLRAVNPLRHVVVYRLQLCTQVLFTPSINAIVGVDCSCCLDGA
jgi:hypothetical protein